MSEKQYYALVDLLDEVCSKDSQDGSIELGRMCFNNTELDSEFWSFEPVTSCFKHPEKIYLFINFCRYIETTVYSNF